MLNTNARLDCIVVNVCVLSGACRRNECEDKLVDRAPRVELYKQRNVADISAFPSSVVTRRHSSAVNEFPPPAK